MATPDQHKWALLITGGKRLLGIPEAASYIGTSAGGLRQMLHRGEIEVPFIRRGRKILFDIRDLDAHCDSLPRFFAERIKIDEGEF